MNREELRARRFADFRRRADDAPESVYRHRTRGWEYIPIHPFGDEPDVLERLKLRPEDCRVVDAWWAIDGDATLLESCVIAVSRMPVGLLARATPHEQQWVYLSAVFDAAYVMRAVFEEAMERFADAGFPSAPRFRLRDGEPRVRITPLRQ